MREVVGRSLKRGTDEGGLPDVVVIDGGAQQFESAIAVRDEAHRFAITYHRKERGRIESRLDSIPKIGPARRKALLRAFGSVQGIEAASVEAIAAVEGIGMELARAIREHLSRPKG